ncbi:MAG: cation diffusion facilitator family transporter [Sphingobacteriaceae bacterium]|nr:cation diffusion facilitator family transporter [Sphingobacteriaceae bacterium]
MKPQKKAILISLVVGIVLMLVKFFAYFITQSNAILTDAAESIVNVIASAFALYSIYLSTVPKDQNHPYGHGKVEFFSVFIEGLLIGIAGLVIIFKASYNLIYPEDIRELYQGAFIIIFTGMVNAIVAYYLMQVARKNHSITLEADAKHLYTDAITSVGLFVSLIVIQLTTLYWLDSVISIALGAYISYNAYTLIRKSIGGLMDESNLKLVEDIVLILQEKRTNNWIDIHNLRAQQYGADLHIDCHITLPYYFNLNQVHQEISDLDDLVNAHTERKIEFFIHADPCLPQCCRYCTLKNCEMRQQPFEKVVQWNLENVIKNQKHFIDELF